MPSTRQILVIGGSALLAFAVVAIVQAYVMPIPMIGRFLPKAA